VLHKYTHTLIYCKHNGDDKPYECYCISFGIGVKHRDSAYSGFCVFVAMAVRTRRVKLCVNVDLRYTLYLNFEMRIAGFIIYTHAVTARNGQI